jgi:hypothetical protein
MGDLQVWLSSLTTPEKTLKRTGRSRRGRTVESELAVIVGILMGGGLAVLQVQETVSRWSQVPESIFVFANVTAVLLVTAALTKRMRTGLLCGVLSAVSQFLTLIGFYAHSYGIVVAIVALPLQSLRVLTYPAVGVIGGYVGHSIAAARAAESSRHVRRTNR